MSKKVMICDDEPYILEALKRLVQKEGYQVISADNGNAGLELAQQEKPNLIFLDVMMPGKNGYEVCKALKENQDTRDIFIIMLTAMCGEEDRKLGLEVGADKFMTKPFSPRVLREMINKILA